MIFIHLITLANALGSTLSTQYGAPMQENIISALLQNESRAHLVSDEGLEEELALVKVLAQIEDVEAEVGLDGEEDEDFGDEEDFDAEDFDYEYFGVEDANYADYGEEDNLEQSLLQVQGAPLMVNWCTEETCEGKTHVNDFIRNNYRAEYQNRWIDESTGRGATPENEARGAAAICDGVYPDKWLQFHRGMEPKVGLDQGGARAGKRGGYCQDWFMWFQTDPCRLWPQACLVTKKGAIHISREKVGGWMMFNGGCKMWAWENIFYKPRIAMSAIIKMNVPPSQNPGIELMQYAGAWDCHNTCALEEVWPEPNPTEERLVTLTDFPDGTQFYVNRKSGFDWAEAREFCQLGEGDLVSVHSEAQWSALQTLMKKSSYWLGAYDQAPTGENGKFVWKDGTPWDYGDWGEGEPNNRDNIEDCLSTEPEDSQKWYDSPCLRKRRAFICQFAPGKFNADGYSDRTYVENRDYWFTENGLYSFHKVIMERDDASGHCKSRGGNLVSINSAEEKAYIEANFKVYGKRTFWIGATVKPDATFEWDDGSDTSFQDWAGGAPNIRTDRKPQNWSVWTTTSKKNWIVKGGHYKMSFICEYPEAQPIPEDNDKQPYDARVNAYNAWVTEDIPMYKEAQTAFYTSQIPSFDDSQISSRDYFPGDEEYYTIPWNKEPPNCDSKILSDEWRTSDDCNYTAHDKPKTKDAASEDCKSRNGNLVSVFDWHEKDKFCPLITATIVRPYWIGLSDWVTEGTWVWDDGSTSWGQWTNWAEKPSSDSSLGHCASIGSGGGHEWRQQKCDIEMGYLCEYPENMYEGEEIIAPPDTRTIYEKTGLSKPTNCAETILSDDYLTDKYWQYTIHTEKNMTWNDASEDCKSRKGTLVNLTNSYENAVMRMMLPNHFWGMKFWVGLSNTNEEGTWLWEDNTEIVDFMNWKRHTKNRTNKCVYLDRGHSHLDWGADECDDEHNFICEYPDNIHWLRPELKNYENADLPIPNWHKQILSDYYHTSEDWKYSVHHQTFAMNASDAEEDCESRYGSLVSINSSEDNDAIDPLLQGQRRKYWIGLSDRVEDGTFFWDDGTDLTYTNWTHGEPKTGNHCVSAQSNMNTGIMPWSVQKCDENAGYICEYPDGMFAEGAEPEPFDEEFRANQWTVIKQKECTDFHWAGYNQADSGEQRGIRDAWSYVETWCAGEPFHKS